MLVLRDVCPVDVHLEVHVARVGVRQEVLEAADAARTRRAAQRVERPAVEQEAVRDVVVVRVQLQAVAGRALTEDVPPIGCEFPVGDVRAAGGVVAGSDVPEPEDVRDLALRVECRERGVGDRPRDVAVVALGLEPVVVEPFAQLVRAGDVVDVAALGVRVLVVSRELDLLVPDAGELLEDLLEARREVGRVRVARDGVADRVEDDAPLAGGQEHTVARGLHRAGYGGTGRGVGGAARAECGGTECGGRGHARRRCEQLAPRETEPATQLRIVAAIDQIVS